MKLSIIDPNTMKLEHNDEPPIICSIKEFSRASIITFDDDRNIIDPFIEINKFMNDVLRRHQREEIWKAYRNIFQEFEIKSVDVDKLFKCIQDNFKAIYDIIKIDDIEKFMHDNEMFNIPHGISDNFTGEYNEDTTYDRKKYEGLIALSVGARLAIPVWGEFSLIRKPTIGANMLPIPLMKMLSSSSIITSKQFKDYETYSIATVDAGTHAPELVAAGLGTEFNVSINLAANFVKKIAIGLNLSSNPSVNNIYNFIANRGAYNSASGGDFIWAKTDPGRGEEKSRLEKYSLREQMSQGDIAMIEYYLGDPSRIIYSILQEDKPKLVKLANSLSKHLESINYVPNDVNIRLCQWVLAFVIPPKVLTYVGLTYQNRTLAVVTTILIYLGFPHLAALVVSSESVSKDGLVISYKVTRREMPQEYIDKLDIYYPLKPKAKDSTNMAIIAINNLYALINNSVFAINANKALITYMTELGILNKHERFSVIPETPIELAKMIIKINELGESMTRVEF